MTATVEKLPVNITQFDTQTTSVVPESMPQAFYDKALLELLRHKMQMHHKFAQKRPMPKNNGDTVSFRKITKLDPATTPLTEGETPAGNSVGMQEITAQTQQYGDYIVFSDLFKIKTIDPIITEYIKELSDQANETLDVLSRDVLSNGTNVMYAGGKTSRSALSEGDTLSLTDIRKGVRFFRKNYVKPISNGDYACLISPDTEYDFFDDPAFKEIADYGGNVKPWLDNEIGRMHNTRFFMTPNAKVFTDAVDPDGTPDSGDELDVHSAIMLGKDAYGITTIQGEGNAKSIIKGAGSAGTEDPLDQRSSAGWKVNAFTTVRLNEIAMIRFEHIPSV